METPRSIAGERATAAQDARSAIRAPLAVAVELNVAGRRQRAETRDVSPFGLGIWLRSGPPADLRAGHAVEVEFGLPGIAPPIAVETEIAWHDEVTGRLGVRFRSLDPGLRALLDAFASGRL